MVQRYLEPSSAGLRMPTDPNKENGQVINQPRFAEFGGLDGAKRVAPGVNAAKFENGNPFRITKANGGR